MGKFQLDLNEGISEHVSFDQYLRGKSGSSERQKRMLKLLKTAMTQELSQRQRDCMQFYYFEQRPVKEIAGMLQLRPTTVYKHLKRGRCILKEVCRYL